MSADHQDTVPDAGIVLTDEQRRRRRKRSVALGLVLFGLCVLFYVVTVYKLGANVLDRAL